MDSPRLRVVGVLPSDVRTEEEIRAGVPSNDAEMPDDETVLDTLVANGGIIVRVAAALNLTEAYVMHVISRNLGSLSRKLRGRLMLSSFVTTMQLDALVQMNAGDMPLDALGRTYAASVAAFTNLAEQLDTKEEVQDTDDADAAKESLLDRLARMGKREEAERVLDEEAG